MTGGLGSELQNRVHRRRSPALDTMHGFALKFAAISRRSIRSFPADYNVTMTSIRKKKRKLLHGRGSGHQLQHIARIGLRVLMAERRSNTRRRAEMLFIEAWHPLEDNFMYHRQSTARVLRFQTANGGEIAVNLQQIQKIAGAISIRCGPRDCSCSWPDPESLLESALGKWKPETFAFRSRIGTIHHALSRCRSTPISLDPASREAVAFDTASGLHGNAGANRKWKSWTVKLILLDARARRSHRRFAAAPKKNRRAGLYLRARSAEGAELISEGRKFDAQVGCGTRLTWDIPAGNEYVVRGLARPSRSLAIRFLPFDGRRTGCMMTRCEIILEKILTLPDGTISVRARPITTVGGEKHHNPFLRSTAVGRGLCRSHKCDGSTERRSTKEGSKSNMIWLCRSRPHGREHGAPLKGLRFHVTAVYDANVRLRPRSRKRGMRRGQTSAIWRKART